MFNRNSNTMTILYVYHYPAPFNGPQFSVALSDAYLNDENTVRPLLVQKCSTECPIVSGDKVIIAFNKVTGLVIKIDKYTDEADTEYDVLYKRNKDILVFTFCVSPKYTI